MKVVLREDVKRLGNKGDIIDVAEGYGRNYLIPRGLAVAASKGVLKDVNFVQDSRAKKDARQEQDARDLATRLQELTVTVAAKSGEGGKLYGAVTSRDVAAELERLLSEKIDRRKIEIPEAIKKPGSYLILIRLYPGVQVEITLNVVAK
ncbi:MAG: 50S ribosomal protein L9 [Syntrophaceticus sp.]|jgi:large subunit ribosomal protein L9|nr:50S ribosomal protein L9 [Syntrophaceticus sp.]